MVRTQCALHKMGLTFDEKAEARSVKFKKLVFSVGIPQNSVRLKTAFQR